MSEHYEITNVDREMAALVPPHTIVADIVEAAHLVGLNPVEEDAITEAQYNAHRYIEYVRGIPGEFGCLKGLLLLPCVDVKIRDRIDLSMIASRLDEINRAALSALREG